MNIAFFCSPESGSTSFTFVPPDVDGWGVGGAEISLIRLAAELSRQGHNITVWNNPVSRSTDRDENNKIYDGVLYRDADEFFPEDHKYDVFVLYRNPYSCLGCVSAGLKLFWSTDQQTCGNYAQDIFPFVDLTIAISEYHRQYHIETYGVDPDKIIAIDLGVVVEEYDRPVAKVPNRLLYASVPSRGLQYLPELFWEIRARLDHLDPKPELFIASDFSLWGKGIAPGNERFKQLFDGMDGVHFVGKLPRKELVELQLSSDVLAYPNAPDGQFAELFGVSVAEAQVAGCVPVTSAFGAFPTTVIEELSLIGSEYDPMHPTESLYQHQFVTRICALLDNRPLLSTLQNKMSLAARTRFNYSAIANQWLTAIYAFTSE